MERKKYLIVTAGGKGVRMGGPVPKQFLMLGGKSVLQLSIERFLEAQPGIKIIVVLPQDHIAEWKEYCLRSGFSCPQTIVAGGFTRFHSVKNGLERVPDGALVAVHDGVRPFVTPSLINKLFAAAESSPAVVPVTPCTDTLKMLSKETASDGEIVLRQIEGGKVDRNLLFGAQTPQIFHSEILKQAYSQAFDTSFTDDASVLEKMNVQIDYISGERYNIKITTKEDLIVAQALLSAGGKM